MHCYDFSRSRFSFTYSYNINHVPIKLSDNSVRDLGFTLTKNLYPSKYIEDLCCECYVFLNYLVLSPAFLIISTSKLPSNRFNCGLVRPILEYDSMVPSWELHTSCARDMIEQVPSFPITKTLNHNHIMTIFLFFNK